MIGKNALGDGMLSKVIEVRTLGKCLCCFTSCLRRDGGGVVLMRPLCFVSVATLGSKPAGKSEWKGASCYDVLCPRCLL